MNNLLSQQVIQDIWSKDTDCLLLIKKGDIRLLNNINFFKMQLKVLYPQDPSDSTCRFTITEINVLAQPDCRRTFNRFLKECNSLVFGVLEPSIYFDRRLNDIYFYFLGDRLELQVDSATLANAIAQSAAIY